MDSTLGAILIILGFGSVLFLAYVTTRYLGGKSIGVMKGKYISIVETVNLGLDKRLHLIRVDQEFVLIASSGKSIEFLTKVALEDYDSEMKHLKNNANTFDFKSFFDKYLKNITKKQEGKKSFFEEKSKSRSNIISTVDTEDKNSQEDKAIFKSNLDRLRSLTKNANDKDRENGDDKINEGS